MTDARHVVLLAAAGAPLRRMGGRWCRMDLPEPLPPAPVDDAALWQLLDDELLEWQPREHRLQTRQVWPSEDGWGEAEDLLSVLAVSSDGRPSRLEILQRLAAAGEAIQTVRELTEDEIDEDLCGPVVEWVAPQRGGPWTWHADPRPICYGNELWGLVSLGLVVDVGGRALLTGAGRWCAAARAPSCHEEASDDGGLVG